MGRRVDHHQWISDRLRADRRLDPTAVPRPERVCTCSRPTLLRKYLQTWVCACGYPRHLPIPPPAA